MKTLLISLMPLLALAWQPPPGYEIVRQDSNRVEVRDLATGYVIPYWIGDTPSVNYDFGPQPTTEDTVRPWYYFERLAVLPWYWRVATGDLNHSGIGELYGGLPSITYLDTLISGWQFEHMTLLQEGAPTNTGDTDGDGLGELLTANQWYLRLWEATDYHSYPDSVVWTYEHNSYRELAEKLGDLDGDGFGEILFYYGQRAYGYNVYEVTDGGDYVWKTAIPFYDYVYDYTGEPSFGDVDGDGRMEVFAGGIHGEVIVFENVADDSFEFVWQGDGGAANQYSTAYLGDTDGDGRNEFMITNSSMFSIFEGMGDNDYELVLRISIPSYWASDGDIVPGAFTGWGQKQIALCTGRYITILEAVSDNEWIQLARYANEELYLEIYGYKVNNIYNDVLVNLVRGPTYMTRLLGAAGPYYPGDANASGAVNVVDVSYLVNYLSGHVDEIIPPLSRADVNGSCEINIVDVTFLVNYLTGSGPAPEPGWCHLELDQ